VIFPARRDVQERAVAIQLEAIGCDLALRDGRPEAERRVHERPQRESHPGDNQARQVVKEFKLAEHTGVGGSTGGVAFSPDKQQRLLSISDLTNNHIYFLDRDTGKEVGRMGSMGDNGALFARMGYEILEFWGLHMIAVESKGNIYTGEVFHGERVQRFVPADSPRGKILEQLSKAAP
jgi:hypothetical protein